MISLQGTCSNEHMLEFEACSVQVRTHMVYRCRLRNTLPAAVPLESVLVAVSSRAHYPKVQNSCRTFQNDIEPDDPLKSEARPSIDRNVQE